eukprot:365758-Chlamydomonas_euryale.AAC.13
MAEDVEVIATGKASVIVVVSMRSICSRLQWHMAPDIFPTQSGTVQTSDRRSKRMLQTADASCELPDRWLKPNQHEFWG